MVPKLVSFKMLATAFPYSVHDPDCWIRKRKWVLEYVDNSAASLAVPAGIAERIVLQASCGPYKQSRRILRNPNTRTVLVGVGDPSVQWTATPKYVHIADEDVKDVEMTVTTAPAYPPKQGEVVTIDAYSSESYVFTMTALCCWVSPNFDLIAVKIDIGELTYEQRLVISRVLKLFYMPKDQHQWVIVIDRHRPEIDVFHISEAREIDFMTACLEKRHFWQEPSLEGVLFDLPHHEWSFVKPPKCKPVIKI